MYYLAFDVSKEDLDAVLTNLRTKTISFKIKNTEQDILNWMNNIELPKKIIAGCESTGGYHFLIQKIFVSKNIPFKLLNPILTKQFIRTTIRKRKTDKSDGLIIAKLLAQGEGNFISRQKLDITAKVRQRMLKNLTVEIHKFNLMRKSLVFSGLDGSDIDAYLKEIQQSLKSATQNYFKDLSSAYADNNIIKLLMTVPGIGFRIALTLWTEIGDIHNFSHAKQLIAFAGLDPKIRQSGHCLNSQGKLTKRGSPYLRHAIFLAANVARMYDPELKIYYTRKRSEGKRHTIAVCSVARKLINRIFAVWHRQTPFVKSLPIDTR